MSESGTTAAAKDAGRRYAQPAALGPLPSDLPRSRGQATLGKRIRRWSRRGRAGLVGAAGFLLIVGVVSLAPWIAPYSPTAQELNVRLSPPSLTPLANGTLHLLGTDQLGRDTLTRLLYGGRVSLTLGTIAVLLSGALGVLLGLVAGYYERIVGAVVMRLADIQLSIPSILLAIVMVAVLGPNLVNIVVVLAISGWVTYARVVRSKVLSLRQVEYVEAARSLGAGDARILFRHVLPNSWSPVIVVATLQIARMILMEAALSFLGLGAQPPTPTWGNMVGEGRTFLTSAWWLCTVPGLAIVFTVVTINLFGDWLRDALDPKLRD